MLIESFLSFMLIAVIVVIFILAISVKGEVLYQKPIERIVLNPNC